jgi:hypothetical protein
MQLSVVPDYAKSREEIYAGLMEYILRLYRKDNDAEDRRGIMFAAWIVQSMLELSREDKGVADLWHRF